MSTNYYDAENNKLIPIAGKGDFPADYGTKAEFETKKDSLPDGTVFTTTDEFVEGGGGSDDYSTDEKVVGKWVDGKPVYEKTFVLANSGYFNHNIDNLKNIISVSGVANTGNGAAWQPFPTYIDTTYSASVLNINKTQAELRVKGWTVYSAHIVMRYTKTTDD